MDNILWKMMLNNIRTYLKQFPSVEKDPDVWTISKVLSIANCKTKEDVFSEIALGDESINNAITEKKILDLGFKLYGVEENDPYYKITFKPPFKFGITSLSGILEDGKFWLYADDIRYTQMSELKKTIEVVGGEVYREDK